MEATAVIEPRAPLAQRISAIVALAATVLAFASGIVFLVSHFVCLVIGDVLLVVGVAAVWHSVTSRGIRRIAGGLIAVGALGGVIMVFTVHHVFWGLLIVLALVAVAGGAARIALHSPRHPYSLRPVPPPRHAVMFMNPKSGGGKVDAFDLEAEARRRGAEVVVIAPGADLARLARDAVDRGADVLGVAGGDGSQAIVAAVAMEHDLPFVVVPAGTRNHLALDLGLDRTDPRRALDALSDGVERVIDLGMVNGQVFVNNVSLGVYAKVVQSPEYRDDKLGTFAAMLPGLVGDDAEPFDLRCMTPDGPVEGPELVMVSNNPYEFASLDDFGTRERMDTGRLGVLVAEVRTGGDVASLVRLSAVGRISRYQGWRTWEASEFRVTSRGGTVEAGVDGEAAVLTSPLEFRIVPGALRVRLPVDRPGPRARRVRLNSTTVARLVGVVLTGTDPEVARQRPCDPPGATG